MEIVLQQVSPVFLEQEKVENSEVWNKDLRFNKGEKIQLVAPSGSGKTSFIHFLYGLRKDYNGTISIDQKNIAGLDPEEKSRFRSSKISIVFQDLRLFSDHSARENIQVKKNLTSFAGAAPIEEMAGRLGIKSKLEQEAGKCSYGEQQRIAIIRALQQPFEYLILDEPFSHLDEANARKAMALIEEEVEKRNAAILLTDLSPISFFYPGRSLNL